MHVLLVPHLFGVVVHHAGWIVHSQADLIVPLAGLRPPQPDLVFAELAGDVGNDFPHVQPFPRAVISSGIKKHVDRRGYPREQTGLRNRNMLSLAVLARGMRHGTDLSLAACVGSRMRRSCSHSCWDRGDVRAWYCCHMAAAALSWKGTQFNSV